MDANTPEGSYKTCSNYDQEEANDLIYGLISIVAE
jgi:hypothetical protein